MLSALINAFRVPDLRRKIFFTLFIIALYRLGSYVPVPGVDAAGLGEAFSKSMGDNPAMLMLNIFSGNALSNFSVFSLGIMPYITASIIMQLMQGVIPSLQRMAREGESGRKRITQITRYLCLGLGFINAVGYLFMFQSKQYGLVLPQGMEFLTSCIIVLTLVAGVGFIMWMGELITQRGVGNGMSLIIFANIIAGFPNVILQSWDQNLALTVLIFIVVLLVIPGIVLVERAQRRIPVNYAKRIQGRRVMGGQSTYIPLKVNGAGVIPIIFASSLVYFPLQLAVFFNVEWLSAFSNALSRGPVNWVVTFTLIVFFCFFYTSMVFNPEDTGDNLRKQGGFIPGVRPGTATVQYIKNVINRITLPGGIYIALIAVVPSILFMFTNDPLISTFGGTSILIMVGVALDTMSKVESQLKQHHYDGFFK
ncbi:MAG: preprotein translocase subunit SecY [Coriobacteriia bacterium]|nr:preprotein translocase subunit SecY [Coriobacteriia bacterium]MDR2714480.1 preprotein translocase subunit SecY [Coriobacteriales bacterium]